MELQSLFFAEARKRVLSEQCLVEIVCELLGISIDSAYRRIRGKKMLTFTELARLSHHFNIALDPLIHTKIDTILFQYAPLDGEGNSMKNYYDHLERLADLFDAVAQAAEKEICFIARDIPGPHFMYFPDLNLFQLYAWFRGVNKSQITYEKFVAQIDVHHLSAIAERIGNAYRRIPSTEIWTKETIVPLLRTLAYYTDLNCFENDTTLPTICRQIAQMTDMIREYTLKEGKVYGEETAAFQFHLSSVDFLNDFMLVTYDGVNTAAIGLYGINYVHTFNPRFYAETEKWMRNIFRKSIPLSGTSEKECFHFFQEMKDRVNDLLERFGR